MPDEKIKFLMRIDPDTDRKIKAAMPLANCRLLFKLAVEMDMMMNVLAAAMEIPEEQLRELRGRCIQEVKKTHGMISLDDAVEYQNGGD